MSTLKATNLQHKDSSDPNVVLYADGSTSIRSLQNLAPNILINGAMLAHQRSSTNQEVNITRNGDTFVADRFFFSNQTGTAVANGSVREDVPGMPAGFSKCLRYKVTTAEPAIDANEFAGLRQRIEGNNFVQTSFGTSAAKNVSLSFWVRCSKAGKFSGCLRSANGISHVFEYTIDSADTWQYITATFPGYTTNPWYPNSAANEYGHAAEVFWSVGHGSDFNQTLASGWLATGGGLGTSGCETILDTANATFHITGTMLIVGDSAIEYEHEHFQDTLDRCYRYYYRWVATANYGRFASGIVVTSQQVRAVFTLPVPMRVTPKSMNAIGPLMHWDGSSTQALNALTIEQNHPYSVSVNTGSAFGGLTVGRAAMIGANNDTTTYIDFSAEI